MFASRSLMLAVFVAAVCPSVAESAPSFFSAFNSKNGPPADVSGMPLEIAPALDFERVLFKIRSGEKREDWRPQLSRFIDSKAEKGTSAALRELALAWEARARIVDLDSVLRAVYRRKGCFPESVEAAMNQLPEAVKRDPWGDAWAYALAAPSKSPQLLGQRYVIGPQRYPKLLSMEDSVRELPQPPQGATLAYSAIATVISLQIDFKNPQPSRAFKQVGERFGAYWVLWLSREGALLSSTEGFVPVTFK
jgi:hypothetical protein